MEKFQIGDILTNKSGKYLQFPNRFSSEFKWQPQERINIIEILPNGYRVHNQDYSGNFKCFETAFIDFDTIQNFEKIGEIKGDFYFYFNE